MMIIQQQIHAYLLAYSHTPPHFIVFRVHIQITFIAVMLIVNFYCIFIFAIMFYIVIVLYCDVNFNYISPSLQYI